MNLREHIIIVNGVDKTLQIESIRFDKGKFQIKFHNSSTIYSYSHENVVWLTHPISINVDDCHLYVGGKRERGIKSVGVFAEDAHKYYCVTFRSGYVKHLSESELEIRRSCLTGRATDVFEYLRQCASINPLGLDESEGTPAGILSSIYSQIDFVDDVTAAGVYLDPERGGKRFHSDSLLFPFGCNASQEKAVKTALTNQISVIQGPPGTGKTQTILNVIANLLNDKKTVLVVSNNNSATENVFEKLSNNGLGFLVAPLGNKENKETFVANQPVLNPQLPSWRKTAKELFIARREVKDSLKKVEKLFSLQERLVRCRQELAEVEVEMSHYQQEHPHKYSRRDVKTSSSGILRIIRQIKTYAATCQDDKFGLINHFRSLFEKFNYELRLRFYFEIDERLTPETIPDVLSLLDWLFYLRKIRELKTEIAKLENKLSQLDAPALMDALCDSSMTILKASLAKRFRQERPKIASVKDLYHSGGTVLADYPIVLSTTFSCKNCFDSDTIFDYVIMDEASQVSVETGFLALACAKNAVIVGDSMQLPNVVTDDDRLKLDGIRASFDITESYDSARHSFLSSVSATLPEAPQTLLREHYRCHPDIIGFCNQKFYGGNLLIMTERNDNDRHLIALTTSPGQHCRGHYNQREIDAVKIELLPILDNLRDTGIITPYNEQVKQFSAQLPEIEVATVHKYQGREKDTIILSVTDDEISEFADNANLLNVAVSRAKNKFCLIVSGNSQPLKGNLHDLINYIKYQQGIVMQSRLHSIFDYLFSQVQDSAVSEYNSENLTFDLLEDIRVKYPHLSHIKTLCHYPLRYLISNTEGLSEREKRYALHPSTHIDFLVINRVTKNPLLAIETDGYSFHRRQTEQYQRDKMKDKILEFCGLPLLRLSTIGHGEEDRIVRLLNNTLTIKETR